MTFRWWFVVVLVWFLLQMEDYCYDRTTGTVVVLFKTMTMTISAAATATAFVCQPTRRRTRRRRTTTTINRHTTREAFTIPTNSFGIGHKYYNDDSWHHPTIQVMTPSLLASSSSSSSSFDDDGNDCNDDNHEQRHAAHEASALSSTLIQQQSSKNNGMSHNNNNNNNNMMKDKKKSARPLSEQQQQQPHPTFLSSMQLLEMVQANHHQHGRRPLDNDREEEKEYISQHRKQCHSILKDCLRYNEWDVVMSTLNYMTDQKLIQRRSTFRTCLYKATTCTLHHHHDPQQQQTPSQKSRKYNRNNKNNNNKHHYDETSGGGGTTTTTTTIRSMTNYDQELSVNLNAALQIIQLQLLAGWPPDATDISLIVFALCRSNNNHNHNNRNGRYNNNNSNHKYLNNRSSSRNSSNNNNYNDKGNRHRLMDGSNGSGNNGGSWEKAWNFVQHYQKTTPQLPIQIYDAILTCLVQQKQ